MAANSNNVYGIIEIYHRSNTYNASIYHHFFFLLLSSKSLNILQISLKHYSRRAPQWILRFITSKKMQNMMQWTKLCKQFARVANILSEFGGNLSSSFLIFHHILVLYYGRDDFFKARRARGGYTTFRNIKNMGMPQWQLWSNWCCCYSQCARNS